MKKVVVLSMIVIAMLSFARINESYDQLVKRYGKSSVFGNGDNARYEFNYKGYKITVKFYGTSNLNACHVEYRKGGKVYGSDTYYDEIQGDELKILLESNLGKGYTKLKNNAFGPHPDEYISSDGAISASYDNFRTKVLTVVNINNYAKLKNKLERNEQKKEDEKRQQEQRERELQLQEKRNQMQGF